MKSKIIKLKRFLAVILVMSMWAAVLINPMEAEAAKKKGKGGATYAVGDNVAIGYFDEKVLNWTILSYDDSTKVALVVSRWAMNTKSILEYRKAIDNLYRTTRTAAGYVRWSENYWRGWCNKIFYEQAFTDEEKAMIQKTTLEEDAAKDSILNYYHDTTLDAQYLSTKQKNSVNMRIYNTQTTTSDYVYFMSYDEYNTYKDSMGMDTNSYWPIRTNTYDDPAFGLFVRESNKLIYRDYYYVGDSIRPIMNVRLGEVEEENKDSDSSEKKDTSKTEKTEDKTTTKTDTSKNTSSAKTTSTNTETPAKATSSKQYANNGTNIGDITLPDDSDYSMRNGGTAQVAIDMDYLNSTDKQYNVTYKSSDAAVFTVDSNGLITATGRGSGTLTVRMTKSNGKIYTMSCRIDIN
ncbi:MAG: hypothetical protein IKW81_03575 [Pseudobutyrivibrio sp.]|nr:hypothetical protein [Pseudobutyrivibrio sp.]